MVLISHEKENGKTIVDLEPLTKELDKHNSEIEKIEIYRNDAALVIKNKPQNSHLFSL